MRFGVTPRIALGAEAKRVGAIDGRTHRATIVDGVAGTRPQRRPREVSGHWRRMRLGDAGKAQRQIFAAPVRTGLGTSSPRALQINILL